MSSKNATLETAAKYRHIVAVAAAIIFLAVLLPAPEDSAELSAGAAGAPDAALPTANFDPTATAGAASPSTPNAPLTEGATPAPGTRTSATPGGSSAAPTPAGQSTDATPSTGGDAGAPAAPSTGGQGLVANCDPATGRIAIPTIYAAPCVTAFSGDNGGATSMGVSRDAIRIVFYRPPVSEGTSAALTAAGASNSWEDKLTTFEAYAEFFASHYETYGREIEIIVKEPSGEEGDDAAAQADAVDIATRIKPFLVTAPPGDTVPNAFAQTLASRGVICVCGTSQPQEYYAEQSPYLGYTTLMSSTQGYIHRAEYVCKRLGRGNAEHAGFRDTPADPMSDETRVYGIVYYETEDKSYAAGVDYFEELLASCGITLATRIEYLIDAATLQEQASTMISRLKADGVTTVIFSGDPITPAVWTSEATNQRWFPEWIVTGSALTDTNLFARTYDQRQWENAFGISYLAGLYDPDLSDPYQLHVWHFGEPPKADNVYSTIYSVAFATFTGIHLAGPNLTPQTFQQGLFSYPPTGGGPTAPLTSYGNHGIWPELDFTAFDDITEVWWDPSAVGPDQLGNEGAGMYRYVDNGRRFLPGQQPTTPPDVFTTENAPTFFDQRPESDRAPDYPSPAG